MEKENNGLLKRLNLFDSTALVTGSMIGSGIFIVSAEMARTVGSPGWLIAAWAISGLLTLMAAASYGELASMMPNAGGQYIYLRESYSPLMGFLYGWTLFIVIQSGTIAAVAVAFGKFTGLFFPWISEQNILVQIGDFTINSSQITGIFLIILLSWINSNGVGAGKLIQNVFTSTKLIALLGFILFGLIFAKSTGAFAINKEIFWDAIKIGKSGEIIHLSGWSLILTVGIAMVGSLFSMDAWNSVTFASGEVINPRRNVPLSLVFGALIVLFVYVLANTVYVNILPLRGNPLAAEPFERGIQYALNDRVGTAAMESFFGDSAALIMAALIMISTFGCNNGLILSGSRVYYAMAKDNLFFKKVGTLNKKGAPSFALVIQAVWSCILCLSGTYSNLLDYVVFSALLFYFLTILAIFVLRFKKPDAERPYKAFGYPVIPAIYLIATLLIMYILLVYKPDYTIPGLFLVLTGIPVFYIWRRRNRIVSEESK